MTLYVLTYDVRSTNHDYQPLYEQLAAWDAAHLQNSVWLANMDGTAAAVRDAMRAHMHPDDTIGVIELPFPIQGWAAVHARKEGTAWLRLYHS